MSFGRKWHRSQSTKPIISTVLTVSALITVLPWMLYSSSSEPVASGTPWTPPEYVYRVLHTGVSRNDVTQVSVSWLVLVFDGRQYNQIIATARKKTGRNPTDRGKQGVKRSLMTGCQQASSVAGDNCRTGIGYTRCSSGGVSGAKLRLCPEQRLRSRLAENISTEPPLRALYPLP